MNAYLIHFSTLLLLLLAGVSAYKLTVTDSSNDIINKFTGNTNRRGIHAAAVLRIIYICALIVSIFLLCVRFLK